MKNSIKIVSMLIIILIVSVSSSINHRFKGDLISDRVYELSYIEKEEGIEFTDIDFYDENIIIISSCDIKNDKTGFKAYDLSTGQLIYQDWVDFIFYPKIMKFEDSSFALYDMSNFVLYEKIESKPTLEKYLDNRIVENENDVENYIFYSKDKYYMTKEAILYKVDFNGEREVLIDLSEEYDKICASVLNDKLLLIQCLNSNLYEEKTLIYNKVDKSIYEDENISNTMPYIYKDTTVVQHYNTSNIDIYSSKDKEYMYSISLENPSDKEMILFADSNFIMTYEYENNNLDKENYRIYSIEDGDLIYKEKLFTESEYTYKFGAFSDNKDVAIIGLNEYQECDIDIANTQFLLIDMKNLNTLEKKVSNYNDAEELVKSMNEKYNVDIFIKEDAIGNFPDFTGEVLKNEDNIIGALRGIDDVLSKLPRGFIDELCSEIDENSLTGVNIYITGKLSSNADDAISSPVGYAYSDNDLKRNCIVLDGEQSMFNIKYNMQHELMHIIDNRISKYSDDFQSWNNFLINDAKYNYSYIGYENDYSNTVVDSDSSEGICFINTYSKTYPNEDRAEIFKLLFYDGDEIPSELSYPIIREKAYYICRVIRENFKSVQSEDKVYWERFK
ncbi:Uncharacterised protein [uncultured Clostridium sp.]|nr:Uncharacterised protein [uncultured Clostridium sp.]